MNSAMTDDFEMSDMEEIEFQQTMMEAVSQQQQPEQQTVPTSQQVHQWEVETDYSEKYCDDIYEYRRVTVPRGMLNLFPQGRTMQEIEWRGHGITMSRGWEHYDHHQPEANVLLFRRVLGTDPKTGGIPPEMAVKVQQRACYIAELEQMRERMLAEQARRNELQVGDMF
ncbi:unnamed protein product [Polarella glacialis]|uniref:Cyclin-dependent kinases regulatory subunit n=2 Tax=Polarella glacialis TaxID=89957 RepID=A0A813KKF5_POLGL|nr:unnamed protein product [Polarella glacialis]CAE8709787.1 unnamed protein product [Polarella glacialis]|eukprot:CAMPEP_0115086486 /NCGR_PEP_ID=MMETSP0227-20121206/22619_1 /TAXON_ID=89957 /ORGANISM="Polarella glacialis, Strain CCMP 1383" /LENGTH=168 /DNA_ID=CAMNT_0002475963 /DNA_START=75 /DNA_END=581 /DNA_ORIENTATION=-